MQPTHKNVWNKLIHEKRLEMRKKRIIAPKKTIKKKGKTDKGILTDSYALGDC